MCGRGGACTLLCRGTHKEQAEAQHQAEDQWPRQVRVLHETLVDGAHGVQHFQGFFLDVVGVDLQLLQQRDGVVLIIVSASEAAAWATPHAAHAAHAAHGWRGLHATTPSTTHCCAKVRGTGPLPGSLLQNSRAWRVKRQAKRTLRHWALFPP